jgi:hypothetical protein
MNFALCLNSLSFKRKTTRNSPKKKGASLPNGAQKGNDIENRASAQKE